MAADLMGGKKEGGGCECACGIVRECDDVCGRGRERERERQREIESEGVRESERKKERD